MKTMAQLYAELAERKDKDQPWPVLERWRFDNRNTSHRGYYRYNGEVLPVPPRAARPVR